jgi:hypothetical protein
MSCQYASINNLGVPHRSRQHSSDRSFATEVRLARHEADPDDEPL